MKLLFDENLSPRLVGALADTYPRSAHVHECGLGSAEDIEIWQHAKDNDEDSAVLDRKALQADCTVRIFQLMS